VSVSNVAAKETGEAPIVRTNRPTANTASTNTRYKTNHEAEALFGLFSRKAGSDIRPEIASLVGSFQRQPLTRGEYPKVRAEQPQRSAKRVPPKEVVPSTFRAYLNFIGNKVSLTPRYSLQFVVRYDTPAAWS